MSPRVLDPVRTVGAGTAAQEAHDVVCSFCRGTGKDPFGIMSALSACCVCGGKRVLRLHGPHRGCPHCDRTGAVGTFTCGVCRGTGFLPVAVGRTEPCLECGGTGSSRDNEHLSCLRCRGQGLVSASSGSA